MKLSAKKYCPICHKQLYVNVSMVYFSCGGCHKYGLNQYTLELYDSDSNFNTNEICYFQLIFDDWILMLKSKEINIYQYNNEIQTNEIVVNKHINYQFDEFDLINSAKILIDKYLNLKAFL
jgi:hypothetical protein